MWRVTRFLIGLGAAIVPESYRDDWTREWEAELWHARNSGDGYHRATRSHLELAAKSCGAVLHALWLRKEEWSLSVMFQDVRYALRGLRHRPGFAAIALLTLTLGIGATAAVFSVVRAVLLAPLPYREPDRLVQIWETNPARNWTHANVAPANLVDWRARSRSFAGIAYYVGSDTKSPHLVDATLTGAGEPDRIRGMRVSANFFDVLGVGSAAGRTFEPGEDLRDRSNVLVLSDGFWRRRFAADPAIVGRTIEIDGVQARIIGVMPRRFTFPGADADYWAPMVYDEALFRSMRRPHWFRTVARLAPDVTLEQARADMTRIATQLEREYPDTNAQMGVGLGPLHEWFVGDSRRALLLLMGAVALVLFIACANVASLLLARATLRRRELSIRVALGAGRLRLLRQLLTESLILAGGGAVLGVIGAQLAVSWLLKAAPAGIVRLDETVVDGSVLGFALLMAIATAVMFGLAPAWQSSAGLSGPPLNEGGRGTTAGSLAGRRVLIAAEVALSVVLLVGAGLLLRSFLNLRSVQPGIDVTRVLSFKVSLPASQYEDDGKAARFFSEAVARFAAIPSASSAGATTRLALEGYNWTGDLFVEGRPEVWGRELRHKAITPGFMQAAGVRLLRGRDFATADTNTSEPVVIVNQALAQQYFPDGDVIGKRVAYSRPSARTSWRTIVGVAANEKQDGLAIEVRPEVYDPHTQDPSRAMSIVVRTTGDPFTLVPLVRRELAAIDPGVAIYDVRTLEQVVDRSLAVERFGTLVLTGFACGALLLSAVGLYGVIAFTVTARTREIGVRLALGASRSLVLKMVIWDGLRVVLAGLAAGLLASIALGRVAASFLFETRAADPVVLVSVGVVLAVAGALASSIPALRASRVSPSISLRAE